MKLTNRIIACVGFLLATTFGLQAQIQRGDWMGRIVLTFTDNVYGLYLGARDTGQLDPTVQYTDGAETFSRWFFPETRQRYSFMNVDTPLGAAKIKNWDWRIFANYSIGYRVSYSPRVSHLGFEFQVDYDKESHRIKMPGDEQYADYRKHMIVPTALMKIRIGDYTEHKLNAMLELGGSYDYTFRAGGGRDVDMYNNGFAGIVGLGMLKTSNGVGLSLRYTHDFYDYFNPDYSPEGTELKPFEGVSTNRGVFECVLIYRMR